MHILDSSLESKDFENAKSGSMTVDDTPTAYRSRAKNDSVHHSLLERVGLNGNNRMRA